MRKTRYQARYSKKAGKGWQKALSLVLLLTILAASFPLSNSFTAFADEAPNAEAAVQQEGTELPEEILPEPRAQEQTPEETEPEPLAEVLPEEVDPEPETIEVPPENEQTQEAVSDENPDGSQDVLDETQTEPQDAPDEVPTEPADEADENQAEEPEAKPDENPEEREANSDEAPDAPEETVYANSISGALWLDILEDAQSGAQHGDGIRQAEEQPLAGYEVSLYKAEDQAAPVETVTTGGDGTYRFENIEPGSYVVGISGTTIDGTEYLLPAAGVTGDNRFAYFNDEYTTVYSAPIAMYEDTQAAEVNAGMRTPPETELRAGTYIVTQDNSSSQLGTSTTLKGALELCKKNNIPCTVTVMQDDNNMDVRGEGAKVVSGQQITLTSSSGTIRSIKQTGTSLDSRHISIENGGSLTLKNVILTGTGSRAGANQRNGGVEVTGGTLTMEAGSKIVDCMCNSCGGAVRVIRGTFIMNGGEISGNYARSPSFGGGAVSVDDHGSFTMNGGTISGNEASARGGAIFIYRDVQAEVTLNGGTISGNTAGTNGGAIYLQNYDYSNPANTARYQGLTISDAVVFSGNTTAKTYMPPDNYTDFTTRNPYPFDGMLLDNDNINHQNNKRAVVYHANNGGIGTQTYFQPFLAGTNSIQLLGPDEVDFTVPAGKYFAGWAENTAGTGTIRQPGSTLTLSSAGPKSLYAKWEPFKRYVVTRDSNSSFLGSFDQLRDAVSACLGAVPCTITALDDDPSMGLMAQVTSGKIITLTSDDPNNPRTITQTLHNDNGRHLHLTGGSLTLKDIILRGNGTGTGTVIANINGGVRVQAGSLTMESGAVITNCRGTNNHAGGVQMIGGSFTMKDGASISGNIAGSGGGGVFINTGGAFVMNGGTISTNKSGADSNGGGVFVDAGADFTMNGGTISGNESTNGSGVYAMGGSSHDFVMNGGTISGNTATVAGGGVFMHLSTAFNMSGGTISGNSALSPSYGGGGIYTASHSYDNPALTTAYDNIRIAASATVGSNHAQTTFDPPINASAFNSRFPGSLLNNDDINYRGNNFAVAYKVNNNTGAADKFQTVPVSGNVTLYTQGIAGFTDAFSALEPGKEKFLGWNTQADGGGTPYSANQAITVTENLTLYAQWDHYRYIVTGDTSGDTIGSYDLLLDAVTKCRPAATEPCTITATSDDLAMGNSVTIPSIKEITLTSDSTRRTIHQPVCSSSGRHFLVNGSLTLKNIVLEGVMDQSGTCNGGVIVSTAAASLTMESGAKITKCYSADNGGAVQVQNGTFTMTGGELTGNKTFGYGGAVLMDSNTTFTMSGGTISENESANNGGGVFLRNSAVFNMSNGTISGNKGQTFAGGVYAANNSSFTMSGGEITDNESLLYGGGVCVDSNASFIMSDGEISGNKTGNYGGGIYSADYAYIDPANIDGSYRNISIASSATVANNEVGATYAHQSPPGNASDFDSRTTNPFPGSLLNNDDINYYNPSVKVTLSKAVTGDYGDQNKAFKFRIYVKRADNSAVTGSLSYTGGIISGSGATAPANGTLTLNSSGTAIIQLKHGQTITVSGIPSDGKVRVAETADSNYDTSYWINGSINQSGTDTWDITMTGTNCTVDFLNFRGSVVATGISGGIGQNALPAVTAVLCLTAACCVVVRAVRRRRHG